MRADMFQHQHPEVLLNYNALLLHTGLTHPLHKVPVSTCVTCWNRQPHVVFKSHGCESHIAHVEEMPYRACNYCSLQYASSGRPSPRQSLRACTCLPHNSPDIISSSGQSSLTHVQVHPWEAPLPPRARLMAAASLCVSLANYLIAGICIDFHSCSCSIIGPCILTA